MKDRMNRYSQEIAAKELDNKYEIQLYTNLPSIISEERLQQLCTEKGLRPYISAPKLSVRGELVMVVEESVIGCRTKKQISKKMAQSWTLLYKHIRHRLHKNLEADAKHRGIKPLDYAEELGEEFMSQMLLVAKQLFLR
jgi:hypothetical protein